jgi:hypothetical protein
MRVILTEKLGKLALMMTASILVNSMILQKVYAEEVNDAVVDKAPQVIKLNLDNSGPNDDEWVRVEVRGNTVKLLHTRQAISNFSQIANPVLGVLGFISPIPVSLPNFYRWHDHPVSRVVFQPDGCSANSAPEISQSSVSSSCTITGIDTILLPEATDIHQGSFTIEYTERNLLRLLTFRIPDKKSNIAKRQQDLRSRLVQHRSRRKVNPTNRE